MWSGVGVGSALNHMLSRSAELPIGVLGDVAVDQAIL